MNAHPAPARCLAFFLALALVAPPVFAPPRAVANPGPHRIFAPYFQVGNGYTSTILVRNRHLHVPATVTPIVHSADGTEVRLPTVQIAANSARAISIEDELRAANAWVGSGALTLEYVAANPTVLNAQISVKNAALGIVFDLPFQPGVRSKPSPSGTLTAPWWFREEHVSGRLVLLNTSEATINVHPSVMANRQQRPAGDVAVAAHQFRELDLKTLIEPGGAAPASQGMISLSYDGAVGAIYPALLFSNEQNGYSVTTQFTPPMAHHGDGTDLPAAYKLPGVMVNQQDARMGFRKDLQFTPYAVLGNTTQNPVAVKLRADFDAMDGTGLQHADLPLTPLGPRETHIVDFSQYLKSNLLPASIMDFTLEMSHPGIMGDVVFQVFSVDQSGNFVFGAEARGNASFRDDFNYWSTAGNNDTMLSVHNVSDEDLPVIVTIGFNEGKASYRFAPVTVPRGGTVGMDLKIMIAQASKPDDNGNAMPAGATFGTLRIEAADGHLAERFMATASIFDPVSGTCGGSCKICNVANDIELLGNPLAGAVSTSQQVTATVNWDDGSNSDATLNSHFSSSAASIISVTNTPGVSGNGMATFSTVGSSTITGNFTFTGGDPNNPPPECPTSCPPDVIQGTTPGTTVSATISQNTSEQPSGDDAKASNYQSATGTMSLGPFTNLNTFQGCGVGYETIGTLAPSTYAGNIVIHRTVISEQVFTNSTEDPGAEEPAGYDDTSALSFQDQDPQSGGSGGKVYDLDAPGYHPPAIDGNTYRLRVNFSTFASLPDGTVISPPYNFYVRLSCQWLSPGMAFGTDVAGDNQIGVGTTKTSWNLQ
jgi:hypothetical protein